MLVRARRIPVHPRKSRIRSRNRRKYRLNWKIIGILLLGFWGISSFFQGSVEPEVIPETVSFEQDHALNMRVPIQLDGTYLGNLDHFFEPWILPQQATAIGFEWWGTSPKNTDIEVYFRSAPIEGEVVNWSGWLKVFEEGDDYNIDGYMTSELVPVPSGHRVLEYKVRLTSNDPSASPMLERLKVTGIHAGSGANEPVSLVPTPQAYAEGLRIVSRAQWGADERLRVFGLDRPAPQIRDVDEEFRERFANELVVAKRTSRLEDGSSLTWPMEYPVRVRKIIVHHTAGTQDPDDVEAYIRSLYYWHTITKGWGDIGYNYLIDKRGAIYEGRAGGDGVIGAHAGSSNNGSLGIALLGNFEHDRPTPESLASLSNLIREKAGVFGLDPAGRGTFRGEVDYNVVGHIDVSHTSCPGRWLYDTLPEIRAQAARGYVKSLSPYHQEVVREVAPPFAAQRIETNPTELQVEYGQVTDLVLKFKNTGNESWSDRTYLTKIGGGSLEFIGALGTRVAFVEGGKIDPGNIGWFKIRIRPKATFKEPVTVRFVPVINTLYSQYDAVSEVTISPKKLFLSAPIEKLKLSAELVRQSDTHVELAPTMTRQLWVDVQNTSAFTWTSKDVVLGTWGPADRISPFRDHTWIKRGRLVSISGDTINPGQIGRFAFQITAPEASGEYTEHFNALIEDTGWFDPIGVKFHITVTDDPSLREAAPGGVRVTSVDPDKRIEDQVEIGVAFPFAAQEALPDQVPEYRAQLVNQSAKKFALYPGESREVWAVVKNTGKKAWRPQLTRLATWNPADRESRFRHTRWLKKGRVDQSDLVVQPDETVKFVFEMSAPSDLGQYSEAFNLLIEGEKWFDPIGLTWDIEVVKAHASSDKPVFAVAATDRLIRAEIGFESTEVHVSGQGPYKIEVGGEDKFVSPEGLPSKVVLQGSSYKILTPDGEHLVSEPVRFVPIGETIMQVDNFERRPAWNPKLNDNVYRGVIELRKQGNKMNVINELPIEYYLRGIAEVSNGHPQEKLRTIVVLARTYALYYLGQGGKHPDRHVTLKSDGRDQVYKGYGFELRSPNMTKAVRETEGVVVMYEDKLRRFPYFNQSDGRTRSWQEVWGGKTHPYAVSVPDPLCPEKVKKGHGVGLSGCGATEMAKQGKTYKEIIDYYFDGITFKKLY